jgi:DNA-binding MarR family transcriptional regulator
MVDEPGGNGCGMQVNGGEDDDLGGLVDAVLAASRVFVGIATETLEDVAGDLTLPQFRALAAVDARGPCSVGELAEELGVHASTATRMSRRLVTKKLVARRSARHDRREQEISLTATGQQVVDTVMLRRREAIAAIVEKVPVAQRRAMVRALRAFARAADADGDHAWLAGWSVA